MEAQGTDVTYMQRYGGGDEDRRAVVYFKCNRDNSHDLLMGVLEPSVTFQPSPSPLHRRFSTFDGGSRSLEHVHPSLRAAVELRVRRENAGGLRGYHRDTAQGTAQHQPPRQPHKPPICHGLASESPRRTLRVWWLPHPADTAATLIGRI